MVEPNIKDVRIANQVYSGFDSRRLIGRLELSDEKRVEQFLEDSLLASLESVRAERLFQVRPFRVWPPRVAVIPAIICFGEDVSSEKRVQSEFALSFAKKLDAYLASGVRPTNEDDFTVLPIQQFHEAAEQVNNPSQFSLDVAVDACRSVFPSTKLGWDIAICFAITQSNDMTTEKELLIRGSLLFKVQRR